MKRFTLYSRVAVEQAPLQVYYSALIFAPSRSIVKKHFFKGLPQWIKRAPEPQSQWGALTQTLEGHCSTVSAVAFSPIANVLASASWDETVKLWDVNTGTEQYTLSGHEGWVRAVAFSPDGKMVASASDDKTVKLWQVATGIEWHTFHDHSEEVAAVAYSSDGKMLASASYDMAVKIWDPSERVLLRTLQGHSDCINTLAFSPDCTLLVSGSDDEEVKLWNMCSNDAPITIQSGFGEVSSVAFSPVGDMVASASNDRKIRLWNVANNTVTQILDGHSATVSALAYSSGGKILASASFDKTVKLWDPYSGTLLQTLESHTKAVRSLSFANDIMLASSSEDRMVNIWEVDAFELWQNINSPVEEKKEVTSSTEESPDLSLNDTVALWDARQCLPFSPPKCYFEATTRVTFSPNGDFLAVILQGRSIELWNVHTKQRLHIFTDAHAMVFLSNRIVKVFLIFWQRVFTQLWDIQAGKELQKFEQTATEVAKSVTKIPRWTLSLDGEMVAVAYNSHDNANLRAMSRNNLIILLFQLDKKNTWSNFCLLPLPGKNNPYDESKNWDEMHTGNQVDTEKDDDSIYYIDSMTFSPDGKVLAATSNAGTIDLVDTQTRAHLQRFTDVMALAFSPEGKTIAVALDGGRIRILNSDSIIPLMVVESFHIGRYIHPCGQAESHGRIRSMVFSPGGGLLAINSGAAKIDLVHIRSGSRLQLFTEASALSFSPDGEILVVALESGAICVLDAHTRTQLCILKGYYKNVESMVFSPDSTILAVTFKSGDTCVLDTSSNAPLHRMTEHRKRITAIAVSPDGSVLASASDDKTIKIRAIATKDVLRTLEDHPETVCALAFSQDGLYLAAAFENAMVWIWNASIGDMRQIRNTGSRVHALAFSPDSQVVASACADKTIRLWDIASGILKSTIEAGHTADSLAFSSDGFSFQTSYGTFHMSPASAGTTIVKREPPKVRIREHWIASALGDMLWLPPEYRSRCTVVCGNIVAMGFSSGQVAIFEFAF
jgi:WD40 repeat protein